MDNKVDNNNNNNNNNNKVVFLELVRIPKQLDHLYSVELKPQVEYLVKALRTNPLEGYLVILITNNNNNNNNNLWEEEYLVILQIIIIIIIIIIILIIIRTNQQVVLVILPMDHSLAKVLITLIILVVGYLVNKLVNNNK